MSITYLCGYIIMHGLLSFSLLPFSRSATMIHHDPPSRPDRNQSGDSHVLMVSIGLSLFSSVQESNCCRHLGETITRIHTNLKPTQTLFRDLKFSLRSHTLHLKSRSSLCCSIYYFQKEKCTHCVSCFILYVAVTGRKRTLLA